MMRRGSPCKAKTTVDTIDSTVGVLALGKSRHTIFGFYDTYSGLALLPEFEPWTKQWISGRRLHLR